MNSYVVGFVVLVVLRLVFFGPKRQFEDEQPPLTAVVRRAPELELLSVPVPVPVPVRVSGDDPIAGEVARFAESIADDLLLEFEVDGWRRSS